MDFLCKAPCPRSFSNARLLHIHQKSCTTFKKAQQARDEQAMAGKSAFERRKRKKHRIDEPEPSTSSDGPLSELPDFDTDMPGAEDVSSPPPLPSPEPEQPPPPQFTAAGRPIRVKRKTWKLLQQLPEVAPSVIREPDPPLADPAPAPLPQPAAWIWEGIKTAMNNFE
ncbi:hypothetical protein MSAN_02367400 [Mycena sanguinolenta]|uniref:C2H2-type domain-containing protein n=1 Tax=Mycena sanguinolenta TaxID=230812 RepID=A0A8H6X5N7_9AGAR|nr:hypothetical protein MSAN_02367400 [Mycena sanguinolenta]